MSENDASPPPPPAETLPANPTAPVNAGMTENTLGMLTHLASLSGFVGVPFGNILGPLLIWVLKKDQMPFVDRCGKEAINFGISMTIYLAVSAVLCLVLIGFVGLLVFGILALVFPIIGAVKANAGEHYEYPLTIRFIV
jgi:uncharacterized Tic20 family protein